MAVGRSLDLQPLERLNLSILYIHVTDPAVVTTVLCCRASARTYLSGDICNEVRRGNNTNTVRSWLDNGGTAFSGLTATS